MTESAILALIQAGKVINTDSPADISNIENIADAPLHSMVIIPHS